jgi:hypothetical protein
VPTVDCRHDLIDTAAAVRARLSNAIDAQFLIVIAGAAPVRSRFSNAINQGSMWLRVTTNPTKRNGRTSSYFVVVPVTQRSGSRRILLQHTNGDPHKKSFLLMTILTKKRVFLLLIVDFPSSHCGFWGGL